MRAHSHYTSNTMPGTIKLLVNLNYYQPSPGQCLLTAQVSQPLNQALSVPTSLADVRDAQSSLWRGKEKTIK